MESARILLVEPATDCAADLKHRLRTMGHCVVAVASSGAQAIDATPLLTPDLVLIEFMLDGRPGGGVDAAQRLREAHDVPVIYLASDADEAAFQAAGMSSTPLGYLMKPVADRELQAAIQFALSRHRAEAKLRKVERWLATTLSSIGDGVIATDKNGIVVLINAIAQRLTGWTEAEAVGRPFDAVFHVIDAETRVPMIDLFERALVDGFTIGVDEYVLLQTRAGSELPIEDTIAPIRDENGQPAGVVVVFRDGTERRLSEQAIQALSQQLEHRVHLRTAQLEAATRALAAFSSAASHDLRAPLRVVEGYSTILFDRYATVLDAQGGRCCRSSRQSAN